MIKKTIKVAGIKDKATAKVVPAIKLLRAATLFLRVKITGKNYKVNFKLKSGRYKAYLKIA